MLFDSDTSETSTPNKGDELTRKEWIEFMSLAEQQAKFQAQAHNFNVTCWDICVEKPGAKLDAKTSTCLNNCVERFIDVTLYITNRYSQLLQRGAGRM